MVDRLADVRRHFDPAPGTIYLDTATYGLPPRETVDVMHRAVDEWQSGTADWVRAWDMAGEDARTSFARLIGVGPDTVALEPAVSVGVGLVAATLTAADQVVVPEDEFPSVINPLLVAAERTGAQVRGVPFDQLADSINPSTTLVAFSLVQAQSGRTAELKRIVQAAKRADARTLVDATHALPFVPLTDGIDFLVCAAYKHLLCPRGVAFLYVAPRHQETLLPLLANWRTGSDPYAHHYGTRLELAPTAARFDVSLAWFSWAGAAQSLRLLTEWQQQGLLAEVPPLAQRLAAHLELPDMPRGTVVSVPVKDAEVVRSELADAGIKAAVRAGNVRLAPHVYTTADQIDRAAEALAPFVHALA
jgi:selenocysteine lyase/cysteine desulfurase